MTVILRTQKNHLKKRTVEKTVRLSHYKRRNFVKRLVSGADAIYYPPQLDEIGRNELFAKVCQDTRKSSLMQEFFLFQKLVRYHNKSLTNT